MTFYKGISGQDAGVIVDEEDAYDYALERCLKGSEEDQKEFKQMLVEWFYSGNWLRRECDADRKAYEDSD